MTSFSHWLKRVLEQGESGLAQPVACEAKGDEQAISILENAFERHRLDVAGSPLSFDTSIALVAAEFLADACWRLVAPEAVVGQVTFCGEPKSSAAHLSADVTLRHMCAVHRRATARGQDQALINDVTNVLKRWPLSGVLADIHAPPMGALDFDGHAGLQWLYAERFSSRPRESWLPAAGLTLQRIELVFAEQGKRLPKAVPQEALSD